MRKEELYTDAGWIDANKIVNSSFPFVLAIGGRGIGKSYGVLKMLHEQKIPFIYMRRTQSQLDSVAIGALNPYNQINTDTGSSVLTQKIGKYSVGFYDGERNKDGTLSPVGEPFALGVALSTFASIRGLSAEHFRVLLFDEIIPERHERPIKEEGTAFVNALESLNRNRELTGQEPLKVIMLSNSNTLNSRIISSIGCMDVLENMSRRGHYYKEIGQDIAIFRYTDSPISERKRNTALYRVTTQKDFIDMSLNNDFSQADFEGTCEKPLKEYKPLVSYGNITVMKHKSNNTYYIVSGIKAEEVYSSLPLARKAFQRKYSYLWNAAIKGRVSYQNATVKIEFEGVLE